MNEPSPEGSSVTEVTGVCVWMLTPAERSFLVRCIKNLKGQMVPAVKLAHATAPLTPQIYGLCLLGRVLVTPDINGSGKSEVAINLLFINDLLDGAQVGNLKFGNLSTSALAGSIYVGGNMAVEVWPAVSPVATSGTRADAPGLEDTDRRGASIADEVVRCAEACKSSTDDDDVAVVEELL
ncbi:hypothetical protein LB505_012517 [Fusarium chuoi]|nr:hypothetical protein LB505_012517 [Fusarium chuoi]